VRDPDLLRAAIRVSGLTRQEFAATFEFPKLYDDRTLRRILAGDADLTDEARAYLERFITTSEPRASPRA